MTVAAFKACYSDFKLVKTRGVVQLIFEVPLHESTQALEAVGGMPDAAEERWFAIARLKSEGGEANTEYRRSVPADKTVPASEDSTTPARARKSWHEMTPAQQAGTLCGDPAFHRFLSETFTDGNWLGNSNDAKIGAANIVRAICKVKSRKEIVEGNKSNDYWQNLVSKYRTWQLAAQVVPT